MTGFNCDSTRHRLDTNTKYSRRRHPGAGRRGPRDCLGDQSSRAGRHAPVILRLQELEFLFNAVQRLRNSEFEGLACSLVRRLGGDQRGGPWDGDVGGWIKQLEDTEMGGTQTKK